MPLSGPLAPGTVVSGKVPVERSAGAWVVWAGARDDPPYIWPGAAQNRDPSSHLMASIQWYEVGRLFIHTPSFRLGRLFYAFSTTAKHLCPIAKKKIKPTQAPPSPK